MNSYESVEEYAKKTRTTMEQAKIRCDHFLKLQKKEEAKRYCPTCKQATLVYEGGCSEMGHGDYVYCENDNVPYTVEGEVVMGDCEFTTADVSEYEEIMPYYDFDVVLAMAHDIERLKQDDIEVEMSLGNNWHDFVEKENRELLSHTLD